VVAYEILDRPNVAWDVLYTNPDCAVAITAPITPVVMEVILINPMISKRHVIDAWNTCFILSEIIELMLG
jgi:hypothetical protein